MYKLLGFGSIVLISAGLLTSCAFWKKSEDPPPDTDPNKVTIREITIETRDKLIVSLTFYAPKAEGKYPAVLLLHMLGKERSSWNKFIPKLLDKGYAVYNVDLRGHGRSTKMKNGRESFYQTMNENDWKKIPDDVYDIVSFISNDKHIDPDRIGIIGASIGANAAIITASEYPDKVKTVVALSPGINYRGLDTSEAARNLKVPTLIAVSTGDNYANESSNQLNEVVKSKHNLLIYNGSEHGTNLLDQTEDLQIKIIDWLNEYLKK